jgi:ParB-like chromosome segregation protein Spo0J
MMCTAGLEHDVSGQIRPWPADRVERWPIEKLIPHANNLRVHREADLDKVAASICKWGVTMPPLVDERGELTCGHTRAGAAAKLGLPEVPVIVARGWSACARPVQY